VLYEIFSQEKIILILTAPQDNRNKGKIKNTYFPEKVTLKFTIRDLDPDPQLEKVRYWIRIRNKSMQIWNPAWKKYSHTVKVCNFDLGR
jgi:hypothetical protein